MLHGGNLREYSEISGRKEIIDFSANINPIGMPSWVRPMILKSVSKIPHYPDPNHKKILASMASYYQISPNQILLSNGIAESLMFLPWAFKIKSALAFGPGFSEYKRGVEANAGSIDFIPMVLANNKGEEYFSFDLQRLEDKLKGKTDALYLNNPHNPTGAKINSSSILELTQKYPQVLFIIDEAFIGFTSDPGLFGLAPKYKNVLVLKSYTKILGTPGLRIGAISGNEDLLNSLGKFLPRWNINTFAGEILNRYYSLNPDDFLKETLTELESLRSNFFSALNDFPLKVFPSESNFHLLKCNSNCALELFSYLLRNHGIALRTCESFPPLDQKKFLRVAIRPLKEQEALMVGMCGFFKKKKIIKKKTPAIMIQGTTSNAGKSLITTAVCRILHQDGYKVFPFKSQNMALNSFVTVDGGEMGRAQAVQALAARVDPSTKMNPILLKPNTDKMSQVIINGLPVGNMHFRDYFNKKLEYFEEVKKVYDQISSEAEVMVLEGAGGPSEINLKANDIVNMNMAKYADANVYLVGDIDRGGMFASFLGTFDTFCEWERKLVKGLIINKFRGDKSLLIPGIDYLHEYLEVPVIGEIPYIKDHLIPEEDCLEFKSGSFNDKSELGDRIDIAVIDTPRISNFTDIDALRGEPDVRIRLVNRKEDLGKPHLILFCGSKSVISDMKFLWKDGLAEEIKSLVLKDGVQLVGVCGGYQFLGMEIRDPLGIESATPNMKGLGLLPLITELKEKKYLGLTNAIFLPWNLKISGYEIHHGETHMDPLSKKINSEIRPIMVDEKSSKEGNCWGTSDLGSRDLGHSNLSGNVWGSYLHGLFDSDEFRRKFLDHIRNRLGKKSIGKVVFRYDIHSAIDKLAGTVRRYLDMDKIYKDLNL